MYSKQLTLTHTTCIPWSHRLYQHFFWHHLKVEVKHFIPKWIVWSLLCACLLHIFATINLGNWLWAVINLLLCFSDLKLHLQENVLICTCCIDTVKCRDQLNNWCMYFTCDTLMRCLLLSSKVWLCHWTTWTLILSYLSTSCREDWNRCLNYNIEL